MGFQSQQQADVIFVGDISRPAIKTFYLRSGRGDKIQICVKRIS